MNASLPLKLEVSIKVTTKEGYTEKDLYQFESKRTLVKNTTGELKERLGDITETIEGELRHASFLLASLVDARSQTLQYREEQDKLAIDVEASKE